MNARIISTAMCIALFAAATLFHAVPLRAQEEGAELALADALYDQGDYRQAIEAYDLALIRLLENPLTLHRMAFALLQLDRYERARAVLERFIEVMPDEPIGHYNLGVLYWHTGRHYLAIPCFENIVARDSTYADAWTCLGYIYLETGQIEKAWEMQARLLVLQHEDAFRLQMEIMREEQARNDPTAEW